MTALLLNQLIYVLHLLCFIVLYLLLSLLSMPGSSTHSITFVNVADICADHG